MKKILTDILIAGGGTSGVCAAIQAARQGARVMLMEETPWLGGMLTAAGVSAIDGNHRLHSGLWGEFRQRLYRHYGGVDELATGWVSNTLFEPHVGHEIFRQMIRAEPNVTVFHGFWIAQARMDGQSVVGAIFRNDAGDELVVEAPVSIDATEYGDLMALAGCRYGLGRESVAETGETGAPEQPDDIIQDLTYVAILKSYGDEKNRLIDRPPDYDASHYRCTCREVCPEADDKMVDCRTMLNYGRLPNEKYMINWPVHGNDYYLNVIELPREERWSRLQEAKRFTLGWIYFAQHHLGLNRLGLADDEFPTPDHLPFIPYNRESRRLKGVVRLTTMDIENPYADASRPLYRQGIAVGDYPLDHHHGKSPRPVQETFPQIPAFTVPFGSLVPQEIDGLIVAEKSISVTHLVNGCTRLQPVVMQIGQAAGAAAALCLKGGVRPGKADIRMLQTILLDAGCWLMPFLDNAPGDWSFRSVQRIGLCGALRGEPISKAWANEMRFHPTRKVSRAEAADAIEIAMGRRTDGWTSDGNQITQAEAMQLIWQAMESPAVAGSMVTGDEINAQANAISYFHGQGWLDDWIRAQRLFPTHRITREEFACLLDRAFDPFHRLTLTF